MEIEGIYSKGLFRGLEKESRGSSAEDFLDSLKEFVNWVNEEQKKSERLREAVLRGEDIPLHKMVVEFEKAGVAYNLLLQVRNKLLEAYQEMFRMQL